MSTVDLATLWNALQAVDDGEDPADVYARVTNETIDPDTAAELDAEHQADAPATATPVTFTVEQVGELWDEHRGTGAFSWVAYSTATQEVVTATVNAALTQPAAPAEGEQIDPDNVQAGDRVRLVLNNGDEATFTVIRVGMYGLFSHSNDYNFGTIRAVYLLHREGNRTAG